MSDDQAQPPRDYGGWRLRRGIGLFGSGDGRDNRDAGRLAGADYHRRREPGCAAVRGAATAGRRRNRPGSGGRRAGGPGRAAAGTLAVRLLRDWTRYRVQVVTEHSPAWRLPGVLAPLALLDAEDGYGGRYALRVWTAAPG